VSLWDGQHGDGSGSGGSDGIGIGCCEGEEIQARERPDWSKDVISVPAPTVVRVRQGIIKAKPLLQALTYPPVLPIDWLRRSPAGTVVGAGWRHPRMDALNPLELGHGRRACSSDVAGIGDIGERSGGCVAGHCKGYPTDNQCNVVSFDLMSRVVAPR